MNRIHFWILTGLSGLVAVFLIADIFLVRLSNSEQNRLVLAQQAINQGQAFSSNLQQLAKRIVQLSIQQNDPGLKDLMARQDIKYTPNDGTNSTENTAAPSSTH